MTVTVDVVVEIHIQVVAVMVKIVLLNGSANIRQSSGYGAPFTGCNISTLMGGRLPSLVQEKVVPATLFASVRIIGVMDASVQLV